MNCGDLAFDGVAVVVEDATENEVDAPVEVVEGFGDVA